MPAIGFLPWTDIQLFYAFIKNKTKQQQQQQKKRNDRDKVTAYVSL